MHIMWSYIYLRLVRILHALSCIQYIHLEWWFSLRVSWYNKIYVAYIICRSRYTSGQNDRSKPKLNRNTNTIFRETRYNPKPERTLSFKANVNRLEIYFVWDELCWLRMGSLPLLQSENKSPMEWWTPIGSTE